MTLLLVGIALASVLVMSLAWARPWAAFLFLECTYAFLQFVLDATRAIPEGTLAKEVLTSALVLVAVAKFVRSGVRREAATLCVVAGASFICALMAAILSPYSLPALAELRFFILYPLLMFFPILFADHLFYDIGNIRLFVRLFTVLILAIALFGLLSYMFHGAIDSRWESAPEAMQSATQRTGITDDGVISTLGNRPNMGAFAAFALLMVVGFRKTALCGWSALSIPTAVVVGLSLVMSFSRTAYVGVAVGFVALVFAEFSTDRRRSNVKLIAAALLVIVMLLILVIEVAPDAVIRALSTADLSLSGRTTVWQDVVSNFQGNPLGVGMGVYGTGLRRIGGSSDLGGLGAVDNSFLLIMVEQGIQGALAWCSLFVVVGWRTYRNLTRLRTNIGLAVARVTWTWYWAFLAMSFTVEWFHALPVISPLWFFFGLQFALPYAERTWSGRWNEAIPSTEGGGA